MQASAAFVSASALGMACGPAIAGLLQTNFKIFNLTFNQVTLPGWVMAAAWLVYLVWLWIAFNEPPLEEDNVESQSKAGMFTADIRADLSSFMISDKSFECINRTDVGMGSL